MPPLPPHQHVDGPAPSTSSVLREVADLLEQDPADCPDEAKRERILCLVDLSGRLDAAIAREVGVFDANTVWAGDGSRSCGGWLGAHTELSRPRANGITHTGRDIRSCPHVERAWSAGSIGTAKVIALLRARDIHPRMFSETEAALVDDITPMTVTRATQYIARWAAIAEATRDAEQAEAAGNDPDDVPDEDPRARNAVHRSRSLDGRWLGDSDYDAVSGAEIDGAVAARIDAKFAAGVYTADDGMTAAQRRAECEYELIMAGANPTQTKHGEVRPSVSIELDARTLLGIPIEDLEDAARRLCQLADGTPIPRSTAERLLCTCRLTAIATKLAVDGVIEIVGITDLLRDATAKQRKALRKRDGGCVFTGCAAPFDWCEAHHLWQHEQFGPTLLKNLVLLCKHHHHLVHEGGWHLWRDHTDGHLYLRKPDGNPVPVVPYGHQIPHGEPPPTPPPPPATQRPSPLPHPPRTRPTRAPQTPQATPSTPRLTRSALMSGLIDSTTPQTPPTLHVVGVVARAGR